MSVSSPSLPDITLNAPKREAGTLISFDFFFLFSPFPQIDGNEEKMV